MLHNGLYGKGECRIWVEGLDFGVLGGGRWAHRWMEFLECQRKWILNKFPLPRHTRGSLQLSCDPAEKQQPELWTPLKRCRCGGAPSILSSKRLTVHMRPALYHASATCTYKLIYLQKPRKQAVISFWGGGGSAFILWDKNTPPTLRLQSRGWDVPKCLLKYGLERSSVAFLES